MLERYGIGPFKLESQLFQGLQGSEDGISSSFELTSKTFCVLRCNSHVKKLPRRSQCYVITSISSNFQDALHATLQHAFNFQDALDATL